MVMVADVGEMAVVRDEGMVHVRVRAVQVATTEKGQLAESVEKVVNCCSSMPTMHNTLLFPSLFTLTFGKYP